MAHDAEEDVLDFAIAEDGTITVEVLAVADATRVRRLLRDLTRLAGGPYRDDGPWPGGEPPTVRLVELPDPGGARWEKALAVLLRAAVGDA